MTMEKLWKIPGSSLPDCENCLKNCCRFCCGPYCGPFFPRRAFGQIHMLHGTGSAVFKEEHAGLPDPSPQIIFLPL